MSLQTAKQYLDKLIHQNDNLSLFVYHLKNAKKHDNRIFLAGNGGSAYITAHFASDLMNLGYDVQCLTTNTARLTAITNDYGWEFAYTKQLEHFKQYDILILISVHGGGHTYDKNKWSSNLLLAAIEAKKKKGKVLSLVGCDGGQLKGLSEVSMIVPSDNSYYVEGLHSLLCHIICEQLKESKK